MFLTWTYYFRYYYIINTVLICFERNIEMSLLFFIFMYGDQGSRPTDARRTVTAEFLWVCTLTLGIPVSFLEFCNFFFNTVFHRYSHCSELCKIGFIVTLWSHFAKKFSLTYFYRLSAPNPLTAGKSYCHWFL